MIPEAARTTPCTVNGTSYARASSAHVLADFSATTWPDRHPLGCEHGVCGACTLLVDGEPCGRAWSSRFRPPGPSSPPSRASRATDGPSPDAGGFWERHALQCGFCTPGILMALSAFLRHARPAGAESARRCRATSAAARATRPSCARRSTGRMGREADAA